MHRATPLLIGALVLGGAVIATAQVINVTPLAITERSTRVPAARRAQADSRLMAQAKRVDAGAAKSGDTTVATRLAAEFATTPDLLLTEREKYGVGWGEIVIAHTLAANVQGDVTADQLFGLRKQGMGWGQIAAGLNLSLRQAVNAVRVEGRVALGLAKGDGKVMRIPAAS